MSEYCYQCLTCGEFFEFCKCPDGFKDPMAWTKERGVESELEK